MPVIDMFPDLTSFNAFIYILQALFPSDIHHHHPSRACLTRLHGALVGITKVPVTVSPLAHAAFLGGLSIAFIPA